MSKHVLHTGLALTWITLSMSCGVEPEGPPSAPAVSQVEDGIWSWWVHPLSVNAGPVSWIGSLSSQGEVQVLRINEDFTSDVVVLDRIQVDDHNGPAIAYDPSASHLVVFYAEHNLDNLVHFRTVDRQTLKRGPRRTLAFSDVVTYAQALVHGRRILLLTRVGYTSWRYRISDDFGGTWSPERTLVSVDAGQVYCLARPRPGRAAGFHLAFVGHPRYSTFRDVTHATIQLDTGRISLADTTVVGNLHDPSGPGLDPDVLDRAISPKPGWAARLLDVGSLGGVPAITYALWKKGSITEPVRYRVRRYRQGRWYDAPWELEAGVVFGHHLRAHYHGGAVLSADQSLFTSREEAGDWFLEQWAWDAGAETFRRVREVYASPDPVVRPYVPEGDGRVTVLAQELLRYASYQKFEADIKVVFR